MTNSLFPQNKPLADTLRPKTLGDVLGQDNLLNPKSGQLNTILNAKKTPSIILWGPPGSGKTTIARLLTQKLNARFVQISAVFSGVADLRKVFSDAQQHNQTGTNTILFVDEIHRFNRPQQDSFLPYIENGTISLIGATTENPSFELNNALLSRCRVLEVKPLRENHLETLLQRAEQHANQELPLQTDARKHLLQLADGDGRYVLNLAETLLNLPANTQPLGIPQLAELLQKRAPLYDKSQEAHYNLISALHKSMRGSDPDAALYWFARMINGGEDPRYIARRLVQFATEDVGLANPHALTHTIAAWNAYERLGSPEGELALANAVLFLASAPKSNAAYHALKLASDAAKDASHMPPKHILNAPTRMMRDLGYAEGYQYDHNQPDEFSGQDYFPETMSRQDFYQPKGKGAEAEIKKRLDQWRALRAKK
ncbi:MAG: replication-associated recombination protein A [Alphaproteobacteria bacterium]